MTSCLFCQIIHQTLPTPLVYKDPHVVAFRDIAPQAPHHILIVPRRHIATLNDLTADDIDLTGQLIRIGTHLAYSLGIESSGYRLVFNCNQDAGQAIFHIHLHLLGGRPLTWPPG